jgi:hypothetical protein
VDEELEHARHEEQERDGSRVVAKLPQHARRPRGDPVSAHSAGFPASSISASAEADDLDHLVDAFAARAQDPREVAEVLANGQSA